jgi:hypothetical protein
MRHNSVRNIDSEVVGRIACASLRHEDEIPRTIVGPIARVRYALGQQNRLLLLRKAKAFS